MDAGALARSLGQDAVQERRVAVDREIEVQRPIRVQSDQDVPQDTADRVDIDAFALRYFT